MNEKIPQGTDLEILLVNSCKIDAIKVQTIIDEFLIDNKHNYILSNRNKGKWS